MRRTLVITEAATSTALLTTAELRAAAELASDDDSQDVLLGLQGGAAASSVAAACKVAAAPGGQPTFLRETLTETLYASPGWYLPRNMWTDRNDLYLSRRHAAVIESITIDDVIVDASDYVVNGESGRIEWINCGSCGQKMVIVYRAGFLLEADTAEPDVDLVPDDLKYAATLMVQQLRAMIPSTDRDLFVRGITVEGVGSVQYATDSLSTSVTRTLVPDYVMALLGRYRNMVSV